jgi:hypothetical protein
MFLAAGLLFIAVGYAQATADPLVVRASVPVPGLERPIRVILLSDTHGGRPDMPRARLERLVGQVNALQPDLILLAGDYHEARLFDLPGENRLEDSLEPFRALSAPLGVFAVRGNHDNDWTTLILARAPSPVLLVNEHRDVGPLVVAGLDSRFLSPDLEGTLAGTPAGKPLLLLLHEPEHVEMLGASRAALSLAGHTHGGQIRFGALGSPIEWLNGPAPCRRGPCTLQGWPVYVTSGVGTSLVPLRIGVPPEIVELTLQPSSGRKAGTER